MSEAGDRVMGGLILLAMVMFAIATVTGLINMFSRGTVVVHRVVEREELDFPMVCDECGLITERSDAYLGTVYTHYIDGVRVKEGKLKEVLDGKRVR